jgi:hypothetical protein
MKNSDENPLLKEILADDNLSALRHASLEQGLNAIRRQRRMRRAMHAGMFVLIPTLLTFMLRKPLENRASTTSSPRVQETTTAAIARAESSIKVISDEELFALFPGHSLALIGKPGQQELVVLDASYRR